MPQCPIAGDANGSHDGPGMGVLIHSSFGGKLNLEFLAATRLARRGLFDTKKRCFAASAAASAASTSASCLLYTSDAADE